MSIKNQQQQELKLIDEALKIGPQSDRRRFFVSAAAFGAASAVAPLFANAQSAPGAGAATAACSAACGGAASTFALRPMPILSFIFVIYPL